jgi:hypothetical protein
MSNTLATLIAIHLVCAGNQVELQRGVQEYRSGQYSNAVRSLSAAVQADPHDDIAHYHLANAYLKVGNKTSAIKEYQAAYSMASSQQMTQNCRSVLNLYKAPLPTILTRSSRSVAAVTQLAPYSTKTTEQLNAMVEQQNKGRVRNLESHPGGPEKFKEAPENGALKEDWDRWIQNFRIEFSTQLFRDLRSRGVRRPSGRSLLVFSVDKNGRLRSKVVSSNARHNFNDGLLATTRLLDHTNRLRFPKDSRISGFNFTMGWDYGPVLPITREEVIAELQRTNATLTRPNSLGATAGRLAASDTSGTLSTNDVDGTLSSNGVSASLADKDGLRAGKAGALGLPSFNTSVSGLVLPPAKPVELDAKSDSLTVPGKESKPDLKSQ